MAISSLIRKIFGSRNERLLKRLNKIVLKINTLEPKISQLSNKQLHAKTSIFKQRLSTGEKLDAILPEVFAVVREAAKRTLNMRHFDVQLIGGIILHFGKIAEMRTGEGKTLVATLPTYLNALTGHGVHIITVNDYLARRDATWMTPIYKLLGLNVGVIVHGMKRIEKQRAYASDIIYGTNHEFGFDYLRDNMVFSANERMQGKLSFAIVDEVDSILIDEARTPLIISTFAHDSSELYLKMNQLIPHLEKQHKKGGQGDYSIDEKSKQAFLTEAGYQKIEEILVNEKLIKEGESLYDANHITLMHHVYAVLRAHKLFKCDVDYIVKDKQIVIVDEHTGRAMPGRRWSDGLHQAIEAKENIPIESESQTLASITLQNYFRLYDKLAGMTGTADTEAYEFQQIYGLEVTVIPTNQPNRRNDLPDLVYLTLDEKFKSIIENIVDCSTRKQPVLIGTISIETSEYLSGLLNERNISHKVLNAKFHKKEAQIIAETGRPGSVTIATNMAGRGTDIVLGGNLEAELAHIDPDNIQEIQNRHIKWQARHNAVIKVGGLHIIGTERHESRRIDNQLRGRSGRQGDPGSTRFYLSVEDNLMRIFISEKISDLLNKLGLENGEAITHSWVNRAIENVQRKVEGHNFDIRKQLLEFDNVANDQRLVIYKQRNKLMETKDIYHLITSVRQDVVNEIITESIPSNSLTEEWEVAGLEKTLLSEFGQILPIQEWLQQDENLHEELLKDRLFNHFEILFKEKEEKIGTDSMRYLEKITMLNVLDTHWKEHLATMDYMRQSIHLRGYAHKDPKQEYKREAFTLFSKMLDSIRREVIGILAMMQVKADTDVKALDANIRNKQPTALKFHHAQTSVLAEKETEAIKLTKRKQETSNNENYTTYIRKKPKIGRNQSCQCGSGRKYKHCHGKFISNDNVKSS